MATNSEISPLPREQPDRRQTPTSPWSAFRLGGRRMQNRRAEEHLEPYFVDRFSAVSLVLIIVLLTLSILDAVITLILIEDGCEEVNPVMKLFLNEGLLPFLLGKYVLTAAGIPLLLIFKNFYLFGTRLRVGYLIPTFIFLYVVLISYQFCLLRW